MMRLFGKGRPASDSTPPPVPAPFQEVRAELDIPGAIQAHVGWKLRLQAYIHGTSEEPLEAAVVGCDHLCVLGRWLREHGARRFPEHPKFLTLVETHSRFHACAGEIIRKVDAGQREAALADLLQGEYAKYSARIKADLAWLCLAND